MAHSPADSRTASQTASQTDPQADIRTPTPDIVFTVEGGWGVIRLDRPKALNALTPDMCHAMYEVLSDWAEDDDVGAILVCTDDERAFCAGGDVRTLYETAGEDPAAAAEFFRAEYPLNALIHDYDKPYVALVDGVCMGGGVGISIGASHLVMSDRALWAMPETGIGLFPDIGSSWFLPRLPGGLGAWIALTGNRLSGPDCLYAQIADHLVPGEAMTGLRNALLAMEEEAIDDNTIGEIIARFETARPGPLAAARAEIDTYFTDPGSLEDLFAALEEAGGSFETHTLERLKAMSPTSMKVALEAQRRGRDMSFDDCMKMEFAIAARMMEAHDFREGVRALLVDKDKNPRWDPDSPEAVTDEMVQGFFAPLPETHALKL